MSKVQEIQMIDLYEDGFSMKEIAGIVGLSVGKVHKDLLHMS